MKSSRINANPGHCGMVSSSQDGVHANLQKIVQRHLESRWNPPLHRHSVEAFQHLLDSGVLSAGLPVILDSGCGTGSSSLELAKASPGCLVIGVDQSKARLAKSGVTGDFLKEGNCVLLRAELSSFWRLLLKTGISLRQHFLFYPNPWPKPAQVRRRWHGHPVFPVLLALGGEIEMRCNWQVYALEFAQAGGSVLGKDVRVTVFRPEGGVSPFERKYLERQQALYSVRIPADDTQAFRRGYLRGQAP